MTDVKRIWESAVESGAVPVAGPFGHDDLLRALAFGVEASSSESLSEEMLLTTADLRSYVSIRRAKCTGGQEVRDRMLRRMEAAMTPGVRRAVEQHITELELRGS